MTAHSTHGHRRRAAAVLLGTLAAVLVLIPPVFPLQVLPSPTAMGSVAPSQSTVPAQASARDPPALLSFVENAGQYPSHVRFAFHGAQVVAGFSRGFVLLGLPLRSSESLRNSFGNLGARSSNERMWVRVVFDGAREVSPEGRHELPVRANFYLGNDPEGWREGVRSFQEVVYFGLYAGIDLGFRVHDDGLKYEFHVAAGADAEQIRLRYEGATQVSIGPEGDLVVETDAGSLRDSPPLTVQDGELASCAFAVRVALTAGFGCRGVNPGKAFVIDPLIYSTFLGGTSVDRGFAIAVDAQGSVYAAGETFSNDFPATIGRHAGNTDPFLAKLDPSGTALVYANVFGGQTLDEGFGVAVDPAGNAYVTGLTTGYSFPVTAGAFDTTPSGSWDGFLTKFNPTGTIAYSTFLGSGVSAMDSGYAVAVDGSGRATVTGFAESSDFPTTPAAFDPTYNGAWDVFVSQLSADGSDLVFSTYLGSTYTDLGTGIALDGNGDIYVVGYTVSPDFPTTSGAFDRSANGRVDLFVTKLAATGDRLLYSTFLGGSEDEGNTWFYIYTAGIAVDGAGNAYVAGRTFSDDFPTTPGAFDRIWGGEDDAFVAKLDPRGSSLVYSTFLGGDASDSATAIAVDSSGNAYVTGWANPGFPVTQGAVNDTVVGWSDAFVAKLDPAGRTLLHSTFLGSAGGDTGTGIAVDSAGAVYVTGYTEGGDFPTTFGAFDRVYSGGGDAFVAKLDLQGAPLHSLTFETDPPGLSLEVGGTVPRAPFTVYCDGGTSLAIRAPSPQTAGTSRHVFRAWSDAGAQAHTITCDASRTLVATFDREILYIFDTRPTGLGLVVDGGSLSARTEYWWALGTAHTLSVPSPQATPLARYRFSFWNDGGPRNRSIVTGLSASLVATFDAVYHLTVVSDGGQASCDAPDCWYAAGSTARVTVETPAEGPPGTRHVFRAWGGDATGSTLTLSVRMDGEKTVVAEWSTEHLVAVTSAYGTVFGGGWLLEGATAVVSVSPTEIAVGGRVVRFVRWTGDITSDSATAMFLVDGPKSLSAQWEDTSPEGAPLWALVAPVGLAVAGFAIALAVYASRRRRRRSS